MSQQRISIENYLLRRTHPKLENNFSQIGVPTKPGPPIWTPNMDPNLDPLMDPIMDPLVNRQSLTKIVGKFESV